MGSLEPGTEFLHLQDVLGQLPMLRTYTQMSLFFDNASELALAEVASNTRTALAQLAKDFPWLAGQIVIQRKSESDAGIGLVIPCEEEISLIVKDLTNDPDMPGMATLRKANFPFKLLHREKIAHAPAMGESFEQIKDGPARILILQLSAIQGGFVLTFAGVHTTMDMNGLGQIIYLFSRACQQEAFTAKEIEMGNRSRRELIPLYDKDFQPGPDVQHLILQPKEEKPLVTAIPQSPPVIWAYFVFSTEKLKELKEEASKQTITDYISTNDALTALVFQHMSKARATRSPDLGKGFMLRCVDGRKLFGVEKEYLGHMVTGTYHFDPNPFELSLPELSGRLRRDILDTKQRLHTFRALVTLYDRAEDKASVHYCPNMDPSRDIMMSSWAKVPCSNCDFGLLGKPESARRARLAPWEGLAYFMPKARNGEIAVAICLREDDIEAIRQDNEFMKYATYVG